jgi:hypothetical protein
MTTNAIKLHSKADWLRDAVRGVEDDKATYETLLVSLGNRETNLDDREVGIIKKEPEFSATREIARQATEAAQAAEHDANSAWSTRRRRSSRAGKNDPARSFGILKSRSPAVVLSVRERVPLR